MTYARRVDTGSKQLVQAARQLGFTVVLCQGTVDAMLWHPRTGWLAVDWKRSATAPKTAKQQQLVAAGTPIQFIWSVDQLVDMVQR